MTDAVTGKTLLSLGYTQGPWFPAAIAAAEAARAGGANEAGIRAAVDAHAPPPPVPLRARGALPFHTNIVAELEGDAANIAAVSAHMEELMRLPSARAGAIMPDACPSDAKPGTIPVGGVIATEGTIHPGMHSADICCSVAFSSFGPDVDMKAILDAGMAVSHFGIGGRERGRQWRPPADVMEEAERNTFLVPHRSAMIEHFGTQGDGNHFFYVGRSAATGDVVLVTHHGSRKPGALLYRDGMTAAEKHRRRVAPDVAAHNAFLPTDTEIGDAYWSALQIIRRWTKASHFAIHDAIASALSLKVGGRFWNEHNFVFRKSDGLFYHAKGATPAYRGFADDDSGLTLIPLNMAQPILVTEGCDAPHALGFAPHGAGRNLSRTAYLRANAGKTTEQLFAEQAPGIDARAFCGIQDPTELPGAYKNADMVRGQIDRFGLARVVDTFEPYGCIMAGDVEHDAPWRKKREAKRLAREAAVAAEEAS